MMFNSFGFLTFFALVLGIYFVVPKKARYIWLLLASYVFYLSWNVKYVVFLLLSTVTTYFAAVAIEKWKNYRGRVRIITVLCLVLNMGFLFLFKYLDFALEGIGKVFGIFVEKPDFLANLLLPLGISFYTFQVIGYLVDVYRGEIEAERNIARYALFVSYFPRIVQGPIERSKTFFPQIQNLPMVNIYNGANIRDGVVTMLYGYFMKMIVADRAAIFVDRVFNYETYSEYKGFVVLVAAVLFSVQIYCDFAGYTYIAIGASKLFGIQLTDNFNAPYLALSIKDFWDRWHISLTSWFRDYLYFPLGGNRKGKLRKYLNIMIVFLVSGLWHGAGWNFVAWGGFHGLARVLGEATKELRERVAKALGADRKVWSYRLGQGIYTFALVTVLWVFFRAGSIHQAFELLENMISDFNPWVLTDGTLLKLGLDGKDFNVLLCGILIVFAVDYLKTKKGSVLAMFANQGFVFQWLTVFVAIWCILFFGIYGQNYDATTFIYFQY